MKGVTMQDEGKVFHCGIHCAGGSDAMFHSDDCGGKLVMRESVYGAVTRACEKAWETVDLTGWPRVLFVEGL